ncbi:MAG TPA: PQQ-binding-like beta-propeller repeat protein [Ilumatobacteraceae bacterium]|nr:PQQ-binding-like beta-propeller repeat protein [Ilumatobacteraceae bacterium]
MGDEPGADPDAMWKPGYSAPAHDARDDDPEPDEEPRQWFAGYGRANVSVGDEESPAPDPASMLAPSDAVAEPPNDSSTTSGDRTARRMFVATLVLAAVAMGAIAWQLTGEDAVGGTRQLATLPIGAVPAWTTELDTSHVTGIIGTRSTIVVLELVTNDLVGLAAESGVERWRVNVAPSRSIARLEEVDGAAIVLVEESGGDRSIAGYDLDSGERLWREEGLDRSFFVAFQGIVYRLPEGITDDGAPAGLERLDPRTGERLNALTSELSSVGWAHAATVRDDLVEVFDLQTLERVGGPIAIGDVVAASAFDGRIVGLGLDATIRLYGVAGDELSSLQIEVARPDQFDVTNGSEPMLLVMADDEITGYSLSGDRIEQAWRTGPVQVNEITDVGEHTYAVVQTVVAAGPNGGPVRVVDTVTGESVAEPDGGNWVRLGRDGFVVEITDDTGLREAIEGYGYDGVQRWRFDLAREQQDVFLVDGAMVVVASSPTAQTSTLTYLN